MLRASQHPSGKIVEPVTGEVFEWDELKKVRTAHFFSGAFFAVDDRPRALYLQVFIS